MPGRISEDMPQTQSPDPGSGGLRTNLPAGRFILLTLLAVLVVISLGWAALSLTGSSGEEAQAQSSDGGPSGSEEIAQGQPNNQQDAGQEGAEEDYAAFGERENPFDPVVGLASEGDEGDGSSGGAGDSGNGGSGDGTEDANSDAGSSGNDTNDDFDGGNNTDLDGGLGDESEDLDPDSDSNSDGEDALRGGIVTGPNGEQVDCGNPEDEFEFVICEEEQQDDFQDVPQDDSTSGTGGGQQGGPGSGGSGRSGAGELEDDFRNGGGGARK